MIRRLNDRIEFSPIPGQDYYIGKHPVTQQQWEAVMGSNPSHFKDETLPVEMVSFDDAQAFIQKLNQLSGKKLYRLPSPTGRSEAATAQYYPHGAHLRLAALG